MQILSICLLVLYTSNVIFDSLLSLKIEDIVVIIMKIAIKRDDYLRRKKNTKHDMYTYMDGLQIIIPFMLNSNLLPEVRPFIDFN